MMKHSIVPSNSKKEKLKFCVFTEALQHPKLDEEIRNNISNTIQQLKQDGHTVEEIPFKLIEYIVPTYYVLTTAEASSNLSRYDGVRYGYSSEEDTDDIQKFYKQNRSEGFGMEVKRRIMMGNFVLSTGYYDAYYGKAQKLRRMLCDLTDKIFNSYDAIIMPVAPTTAPVLGAKNEDSTAVYLADIFTVFANLTGIPAIALPMFYHRNNMPFGLQLMSKKDNELSLLTIANLVQHYKTS
jgi:aspartyl-tRNA(Asn)/glutamyl-tRNA(Gln) amidotransferase subunit A